jgi:hypothetical protein
LHWKTQIYQKMQREKLYNLPRTSYFITALFCLENERNSERPDFAVAKMRCFFGKRRIRSFLSNLSIIVPCNLYSFSRYIVCCILFLYTNILNKKRWDRKKRIHLLPEKASHFRNVEIWSLRVSLILKTEKCSYKITGPV